MLAFMGILDIRLDRHQPGVTDQGEPGVARKQADPVAVHLDAGWRSRLSQQESEVDLEGRATWGCWMGPLEEPHSPSLRVVAATMANARREGLCYFIGRKDRHATGLEVAPATVVIAAAKSCTVVM